MCFSLDCTSEVPVGDCCCALRTCIMKAQRNNLHVTNVCRRARLEWPSTPGPFASAMPDLRKSWFFNFFPLSHSNLFPFSPDPTHALLAKCDGEAVVFVGGTKEGGEEVCFQSGVSSRFFGSFFLHFLFLLSSFYVLDGTKARLWRSPDSWRTCREVSRSGPVYYFFLLIRTRF